MNSIKVELFTLVYKKYLSYIVHFIFSYINDAERSREIAQEVFLTFWDTVNSGKLVNNDKMILSYLLTIAKNRSLNEIKKRINHKKYTELETYREKSDYLNMIALENEYSTNIYEREIQEILYSSITKMNEKLKSTFILSRLEDLKNEEVARKQGISIRTVENRLRNAMSILRNSFRDYKVSRR